VLVRELKGLCLDVELLNDKKEVVDVSAIIRPDDNDRRSPEEANESSPEEGVVKVAAARSSEVEAVEEKN